MIAAVAATLSVLVVGMPLWLDQSRATTVLAAASAVAFAAAIRWRSSTLAGLGGAAAIAGYAVALWWSERPVGVVDAMVFGTSLTFLLGLVDLRRRVGDAAVWPKVLRLQAAQWADRAAVALAAAAMVTLGIVLLASAMPSSLRFVVTGLGALVAVGAVVSIFVQQGGRS